LREEKLALMRSTAEHPQPTVDNQVLEAKVEYLSNALKSLPTLKAELSTLQIELEKAHQKIDVQNKKIAYLENSHSSPKAHLEIEELLTQFDHLEQLISYRDQEIEELRRGHAPVLSNQALQPVG